MSDPNNYYILFGFVLGYLINWFSEGVFLLIHFFRKKVFKEEKEK